MLLESDATKPGRIEYQYTVEGGITVLFIEVKFKTGSLQEKLDYFGQVIAESICMAQNALNLKYALTSYSMFIYKLRGRIRVTCAWRPL